MRRWGDAGGIDSAGNIELGEAVVGTGEVEVGGGEVGVNGARDGRHEEDGESVCRRDKGEEGGDPGEH